MHDLKNHSGFTLVEMMIVVAIIGILAATALPWFQDYMARSKMTEVVSFAKEAKTPVSECILAKNNVTDCNSNETVGMAAPTDISSQFVESVSVGAEGVVTVAIQGSNDAELDAASLLMIPNYNVSSGISWKCEISDAALNKYMPNTCRL